MGGGGGGKFLQKTKLGKKQNFAKVLCLQGSDPKFRQK